MNKIKFGTDGWRAIIAKDFTVENVARVTIATADWIIANNKTKKVVVGHDCRFAGELFAETAAKVFASKGIHVLLSKGFVSTPMVSLGTKHYGASIGVILTASHNPPSYNGYKLKSEFGGPLSPKKVQEIEDIIPDKNPIDLEAVTIDELVAAGKVEWVPLEDNYVSHIEKNFDLNAIRKSGLNFAYDAMYGAGQRVIPRILPETQLLHCDYNPSFMGQAPEPIDKNLQEFSKLIQASGKIDCGLATDGDADRIGLYNSRGEFVDSHHIILLLIHYLVKYKGQKSKVVTAFSTTPRVKKMCDHYGLDSEVVKIGFKYIADIMVEQDILVGGEESGGIAITGHIPERDGIWMGLVIWEFMAKSGKTLDDLIAEVYQITGSFAFERSDLHLKEEVKQNIIRQMENGGWSNFGKYKVEKVESIDGTKYYFGNDEWVMIRPSGTEPVLRVYAESADRKGAFAILDEVKKVILA
ncbi:MAG: phosphoglucomutase/phosphomannomutase family protein [Flavobacteriales bacterium]|nr:phosphoglucomutase/phosphomannomutase family protein [Flavobacteriales bacterium]